MDHIGTSLSTSNVAPLPSEVPASALTGLKKERKHGIKPLHHVVSDHTSDTDRKKGLIIPVEVMNLGWVPSISPYLQL